MLIATIATAARLNSAGGTRRASTSAPANVSVSAAIRAVVTHSRPVKVASLRSLGVGIRPHAYEHTKRSSTVTQRVSP